MKNITNYISIYIACFFTMFIYSGFSKIKNFQKKVSILESKTNLPHFINMFGMLLVMTLEVFGSIIMVLYFSNNKNISPQLTKLICRSFIVFIIVVTLLYHPPWGKRIPFLSNLTTLSGLLIINSLIE